MVCNKKTSNLSITINRKIIAKISIIPAIAFLIMAVFVGLSQVINPTKAAHAAPGGTTTISASYDTSSVDFHFTSADLVNSAFKQGAVTASVSTNNPTGFTFYISSTDEYTDLKHTSPSSMAKIPSIGTSLVESNFTAGSWGYSSDAINFNPIPKASAPSAILTTNNNTSQRIVVNFGVKSSPSLESGSYTKQLLLTATTNFVPKMATFLPGGEFNSKLRIIGGNNIDIFTHSQTPPVNPGNATIVSTLDSAYPIYAWYDSVNRTVYWWSEADVSYSNIDASNMFATINNGAKDVELIDLRGIDTSRTKNMSAMFVDTQKLIKKFNLDGINTSSVEDMGSMFASGLTGGPIDPIDLSHLDTSKVKNMDNMFKNSKFTAVNLSGLNTSNVESMNQMFHNMPHLKTVNLSNLDVTKLKYMSYMFFNNFKLEEVDMSNWKNDLVTDLSYLFIGLPILKSIKLTNSYFSNARNMYAMFANLPKLTELDLSSFDTSKVTNMETLFGGDTSLETLNISSFRTSNVTSMRQMFYGVALTSLDLSHFDTRNVLNMEAMFTNTRKLSTINLTSFNTEKVTSMLGMFQNSMQIPENSILDISSFNTRSLINSNLMFSGSKIKTIYVSQDFSTNTIFYSSNMFANNTNLIGGNGTVYSTSNPFDKTYARIDAPGAPGYFTLKP